MSMNTPTGNIKYLTKHIKDFQNIETISNEQYLLGISDYDRGVGGKVTFKNMLASTLSTNSNNLIKKGTDDKLYAQDKTGDLSTLVTSAKNNVVAAINELNQRVIDSGALKDIVATYEDLEDYDISKLSDGNIIEVLKDETHDDKTTFYKFISATSQFEFIGEAGGGGSSNYHQPLFTTQWADHLLNDISWLRADTFSWQSGDVYKTAYDKLVEEYATGTEETEGTVTFKRTTNGFKIALATQETAILNKYNTDGIAWYYILDTTNKRFKLPRTKFGFEGLRDSVGDDIAESLPNIKGTSNLGDDANGGALLKSPTGAFYELPLRAQGFAQSGSSAVNSWGIGFDASRSSSTYQDNAPVQERATQMYLYFYVGEYTQSAVEQTAGLNAELFNNKLDLNASSLNAQGKAYVAGLSFPSLTKYTDLVIGASGTAYTAPANGYIWLNADVTATSTSFMTIAQDKWNDQRVYQNNYTNVHMMCPVAKGTYYIHYANMAFQHFRFIYAQGEE